MEKFNLCGRKYGFSWCNWTSAQLCQDMVSVYQHCKADYLLDVRKIYGLKKQVILHSSIHFAGQELIEHFSN